MRTTCCVLIAVLLGVSTIAAEKAAIPRGAKIAVVAARGATQLTLCPVVGKQVHVSQVSTTGRTVVIAEPPRNTPVTVYRPRDGVLVVELREGHVITSAMSLGDASAGPLRAQTPLPDVEARNEVESLLRADGYTVVAEPGSSDFVLYVQSTYRPSPRSLTVVSGLGDAPAKPGQRNDPPSRPGDIFRQTEAEVARSNDRKGDAPPPPPKPDSSDVDRRWDGGSYDAHEWQGDWRESALAVLVPAAAYRDDVSLMVAGRVWEGFTAARIRTPDAQPSLVPASTTALVEQLVGKRKRSPKYLPLCAVPVAR